MLAPVKLIVANLYMLLLSCPKYSTSDNEALTFTEPLNFSSSSVFFIVTESPVVSVTLIFPKL